MTRRQIVTLVMAFVLGLFTFGARRADAGSCGSDSDCAGFGRCSSGVCGSCGSDSDCNGHGRCSGGKCGSCGSDSDCANGRCSGGKCGSCGSDSDCKGDGRCSNGRCGSCGSDSDCSIGRCASGKCGSCGSDSDCKGGRCSSGRCSNALSAVWPPVAAGGEGCGGGGALQLDWQMPTARSCPMTHAANELEMMLAIARVEALLNELGAY